MAQLRSCGLVFGLSLYLAGLLQAQARPIPYPIPKDRAWQAALKKGTRTETGNPGPKHWTDYAAYKIQAELEPETATIKGHIQMTYENRSPRSTRQLRIHLRQNLHKEGSLRNTYVEITGGVEVSNFKIDGEKKRTPRTRGTIMYVRLPRALESGDQTVLSMDWSFKVPRRGAPRMGHENNHVFYLGYWYPQFAVHDDVKGWVAEPYLGRAEFYMGYADYELEFKAPVGWLVRATGELQNPKDVLTKTAIKRLEKATTTRKVVNIVTKAELTAGKLTRKPGKKKLTWKFAAYNVRDCAVSVSDRYVWDATHAVIKDKNGPGQDGSCMIHSVYETRARAWKKSAEYARHTIEFVSELLFPYPWPHMTACEGVIGGGMEFPMMTIIGGGGSARGLHGVTAHELIHMWFPMLVGSNEKARAWMDEGLTSFVTTLASRDYWKRRALPSIEARSYQFTVLRGSDAKLMTHGDHYYEGGYGFASYGKTSAIMHQLRKYLGEELFLKAMRKYVADWAFKHPYHHDLFNTFREVTGQDLDWYFRTWCYEKWMLDQGVAEVKATEGGTVVVIEDVGDAPHPTEVRVQYEDDSEETKTIPVKEWLSGKRQVELKFGPKVKQVDVDPKMITLDINRKNNRWTADEDG